MRNPFKRSPSDLVAERDDLLDALRGLDPIGHAEEYDMVLKAIERLDKLDHKSHVDLNSVLSIVGNLAGVVLILEHERVRAVTTKALQVLIRPRS